MNDITGCDLTIIMPCFNKADYIHEAIQSILNQKTKYTYHIIIADDHSTDGTLEIVEEYDKQHPGLFTILRSDVNQRLFKNVVRAYAITKTDYFTVIDPDDYWTSDKHIEQALDFLEGHKEYTIYCSNLFKLFEDGRSEICGFPKSERTSTWTDFLLGTATTTFSLSSVFRNSVFKEGIPAMLRELPFESMWRSSYRGDSFRSFIHIQKGKAFYTPNVDGCYRITSTGIYAGGSEFTQRVTNALLYINLWRYDNGRYPFLLYKAHRLFRPMRNYKCGCPQIKNLSEAKQKEIMADLEEVEQELHRHKVVLFFLLTFGRAYKLVHLFYKRMCWKMCEKMQIKK